MDLGYSSRGIVFYFYNGFIQKVRDDILQYDPWQQIVTAFQLLEKNLIAITLCHAGNEKFIANFMIQLYANAGDRGNLQPAVFDMPLQGICHDIIMDIRPIGKHLLCHKV